MKSNSYSLIIQNVNLRFGGLSVLEDLSFGVKKGEILGLIGPNGAGKSSILNSISGFYRPQSGDIFFEDANLTHLSTHGIAKAGIARTFQNIELYTGLSTLENLMAARHIHMKRGTLSACLFFGPTRREEIQQREIVEEVIDLLDLEPLRKKKVGSADIFLVVKDKCLLWVGL
jgi:branched-chain amino acid transport system ATP-binding protein